MAWSTTRIGHKLARLCGAVTGESPPSIQYPGRRPVLAIRRERLCRHHTQVQAHEMAHTQQFDVLGDAYLPAHVAAQAYSYATSGSYSGNNPLESGPYSTPPQAWPP
jgi:hypothetical protein